MSKGLRNYIRLWLCTQPLQFHYWNGTQFVEWGDGLTSFPDTPTGESKANVLLKRLEEQYPDLKLDVIRLLPHRGN
jgi:hypothetical protein